MKKLFLLSALIFVFNSFAQDNTSYEKWPVFPECENQEIEQIKACFSNQLSQFIFDNFKVPEIVSEEN